MSNEKQQHFSPVDSSKKLSKVEEDILKFWNENDIFHKSMENRKTKDDSNKYSFYDGPPFATGLPHYGHIVASVIKDVTPRYWTMKGKYIPRKWGWDCHGLPIENIVEKELGSKTKKEIEELGVEKFNNLCRSKVLEYADEWEKIINRLGRWADMDDSYRTMDKDFMESVWWTFKQLWDKDLIYYSYRSMHVCPRCETTLSQSEVSEGYKDVKDLSVIAEFNLLDDPKTSILAWTTTPWTLPGNVALAVGNDVEYVKIQKKDEGTGNLVQFILAKTRLEDVMNDSEFEIIENLKGSDLVGLKYKSLWDTYASDESLENRENGWQVYAADFVTTEDGTGVVHIAPAFGEDDMALGKENDLPFVQHLTLNGVVDERVEAIGGLNVKPIENPQSTDIEVIKYLAGKGTLFHKEKYEHSYPHCWRCDTPLINYATGSWFVAVTKIKENLLENAKNINWTPEHLKEGRFGNWLEGGRDWSISRQRFWASVMPIWVCNKCDDKKVFGSIAELKDASGVEVDDLHKHVVDEISFDCGKCDGQMHRVPDVLDTWFDSGSMPYGQAHYPFENKEVFENNFPADFIAEGIDQTRAWFYYLHVIAGGIFEKEAFKNVITNGIVLAEDGQKMSKKLQNYPDPMEMVEKYGADPLKFYLAQSPVVNANDLSFSEKDLSEIARGTFRMLWQSYSFFVMYANVDGWKVNYEGVPKVNNLLDKWLISKLHQLIKDVDSEMESYHLMQATRKFAPFVDDLSNWYIRRSRKRFWKSEDDGDKNEAYATLHYVLVELSKTIAPFAPFLADEIYKNLSDKESVHLANFPVSDEMCIDTELNEQMQFVRDIISEGLKLRARTQMKVRQPLSELKIKKEELQITEEFLDIVKEELNVKSIIFDDFEFDENAKNMGDINDVKIELNIKLTDELRKEGQAREIIRHIQQMRKKADYELDDRISVGFSGFNDVFADYKGVIAHEVLANNLQNEILNDSDLEDEFKVDGEKVVIAIKK
ncbi:MAG: isoleucine--tRNA ligase [Candidatus Moraniibacteriota bacterium]|jgi:isoleucyl-tRNA synthetase